MAAGKKLLVADDSLTIQKVIRLALSNEGYDIQAVSDGNDAIEQIAVFRPDLILIDVSLPLKSAFEVKRAINEHADLAHVRFVLMCSAFEKVDEPQAEEVGFHGRLTKPFDPAHLRQTLKDMLAQVPDPGLTIAQAEVKREKTRTDLLSIPLADEADDYEADGEEQHDVEAMPALPPMTPPSPSPPARKTPSLPKGPPASPPSSARISDAAPPSLPPLDALGDDNWFDEPLLPNDPLVAELNNDFNREDPDGDIKHLTESTIRMSGLDEFSGDMPGETANEPRTPPPPQAEPPRAKESSLASSLPPAFQAQEGEKFTERFNDDGWSVNEPSLRPSDRLSDSGGSAFQIEAPADMPVIPDFAVTEAAPDPDGSEPVINDLPPVSSASSPSDFYRDDFTPPPVPGLELNIDDLKETKFPPPPRMHQQHQRQRSAAPAAPIPSGSGLASTATPEQLEAMIRKELRETFQKMAEQLLPEMAEKIIKAEIHKMLSES